ncbi:TPA: hypothetical protein U2C93_001436 [Streptococcus suis]|uniref:hypothetical protein n=1 Tax=Streptococcus suis TaxID=1307 RepID=UPI000CF3D131|nr:hypothetical protein [Streptococcus suis]MCB2922224.1 hypothetical protein [Streptococcus suis]MCB2932080.1 hypothetical protein [Streptococcus suis]MCB2941706.1 hypothetical protein [Streptococcus suis]MCB2945778.1 hypothetical protein [Streptococcus suis]MCB2955692.1 hypothetical protein [Streptococcus suis]
MAFTPKKQEIAQALGDTKKTVTPPQPVSSSNTEEFERKKQYQFMLKPSNREKLNELAKESGSRSASDYLDKWLESL